MAAALWDRVQEVFHAALEHDVDARAAFLAQVCAGNDELRQAVISLLDAHARRGDFLEPFSLIGHTIQQYKVMAALGSGGMGQVWLAEDLHANRRVALKLLPREFSADDDRVRRFKLEAQVVAQLNHPNILTFFELGQCDYGHFMVTEFVEGQTLRQHIQTQQLLSAHDAIAVVLQIAAALAAAHEAGVVHRDIKPENVMLRRDGYVKVLDFGLAKISQLRQAGGETGNVPASITEAGTVMGTVSYMSPEQARGERVDARSDVFSLGVVLYELLTGRLPFEGATAMDLIASLLRSEPLPLPEESGELNRIVMRALTKDRTARYATVGEFAGELAGLAQELTFQKRWDEVRGNERPAAMEERVTSADEIISPARRNAIPWNVLLVITTILGILLAVWQVLPSRSENVESEILPRLKSASVDSWKAEPGGHQLLLDISPDGHTVAFSKSENQQVDIFIKPVNGGARQRLTNDAWVDRSPVWSPDGNALAYLSERQGKWEVWLQPLQGEGSLLQRLDGFPLWLTRWSRDGKRIFYEADDNLFALNVSSGQSEQLTHFSPGKKHFSLSLQEDWLVYDEAKDQTSQIFAEPLSGGTPVQLTNEGEGNLYPLWLPDGERVLYSSKRNGVYQICVAWLDKRKPVQLTFSHENLTPWDVDPEGRRIFYVSSRQESDLVLCDAGGTGHETLFTADILLDLSPRFSPDGSALAFQQFDANDNLLAGKVLIKPLTGGESQSTGSGFDPRWAPNGDLLAYLRRNGKTFELGVSHRDGTGERVLVRDKITFNSFDDQSYAWAQPDNFSWSPDSELIAYSSTQAGAMNIHTVAVKDGAQRILSRNENPAARLFSPSWSPNGDRLAYLRQQGAAGDRESALVVWQSGKINTVFTTKQQMRLLGWDGSAQAFWVATAEQLRRPVELTLLRVPLDGRQPQTIRRLPASHLNSLAFAPKRSDVAFVSRKNGRDEVWRISLETNRSQLVAANSDPYDYLSGIAWSPEQKRLCYAKQSNFDSIWMIENFK